MKTIRAGVLLLAVLWLAGCAVTLPGKVYDSATEPRAHSVHVQVNYPEEGWEKGAADYTTVILELTRKNEAHVEMLMLQVQDIDEEGVKFFFPVADAEPQQARDAMWKKAIDSRPDRKMVFVADTAVPSGRPAVMIELVTPPSASKEGTYIRMKMLYVYERGQMVILTCGAGSQMEKKAEVDVLLEEGMQPLCRQYFDSLRFVE